MFNKLLLVFRYILFIIACCYVTTSCNQVNNQKIVDNATTDSLVSNQNFDNREDEDDHEFYENNFRNYSYQGINIFQKMGYTQSDYTKEIFHIMDTIIGLFKTGNTYSLKQCWIEKVNVYENECTGGIQIEPTLNTKNTPLFLFRGFKHYNQNIAIDTIPANLKLWTGKKEDFIFNNVSYQLRAEGTVLEKMNEGTEMYYENIKNYKLYLTSGNKTQCIVEMKKFNDTMTRICWIGDIDGDGKPDFIISSPEWYEDYRILLFLSSYADSNELVKLVSITVDSFAC